MFALLCSDLLCGCVHVPYIFKRSGLLIRVMVRGYIVCGDSRLYPHEDFAVRIYSCNVFNGGFWF